MASYIASTVWGGSSVPINTDNLEVATWDPAYPGGCDWYDYAWQHGVPRPECRHPGMDIGVPYGSTIYAAQGGTVFRAGYYPSSYEPNELTIQTDDGKFHIYGHMSSCAVAQGSRVTAGQFIGKSGTAGSGAHLHFEVRNGDYATGTFGDARAVLVAAPIGATSPAPASPFVIDDRIQVLDGPLNLRSSPTTGSTIIASLANGTQLCVKSGVQSSGGLNWYQVTVVSTSQVGYIAGNYCGLVTAGGCRTVSTTPTAIPAAGVTVGDVLYVSDPPLNLRTGATTAGQVVAEMPLNTKGIVLSNSVTTDGYTWRQVETRYGTGWAVEQFMTETTSFTNRVANPSATTNLTSIFSNVPSTTLSRVTIDGNPVVKVVNAGTAAFEGVRFESTSPLNLTGTRYLIGVFDIFGAGSLDIVLIRARYTDGSYGDSRPAPISSLSGSAWRRVVVPVFQPSETKTLSKLELHIVRGGAASMTFHVDNAKIIEV